MRIIAGSAKGRRLRSPAGTGTRPLTGRAREALFSSLGSIVVGARVLDLFAGSGSFGLEALSRGAEYVVFVERGRAALTALRANIALVGLGGDVVAGDAESFVTGDRFDLVFVDPPYALPLASVEKVLERTVAALLPGATAVVHRRAGGGTPAPAGLRLTDRRRYGDSELWRFEKEDG
jgi:16S rRNA (guanine966-N2)-methyltransferase